MRFLCIVLMTASMVVPAVAEAPPKLPATAKKLTGPEITALYDGSSVNWHNYAANGTGTAKYDLKQNKQDVTYNFGGKTGTFTGKIRVKGDTFCFVPPKAKEVCESVYTDGNDIYEVSSKGIVDGKNQKQ